MAGDVAKKKDNAAKCRNQGHLTGSALTRRCSSFLTLTAKDPRTSQREGRTREFITISERYREVKTFLQKPRKALRIVDMSALK